MRTLIPIFLSLLLSGCQDDAPDGADSASGAGVTSATLALNWYPEAEHGGFVAANELGLFRKRSVEVQIEPGGPGAPNQVILDLATGRVQFAVSNADLVVLARAKDVPIVAVAAPLQHSPRCIMVHESSGIDSLHELKNVELAISEARPFALWMKHKLPLPGVSMVPFSGQVGEFVLRTDFAQQAYVFSEPFVAREQNSDPKVLMLSEIGFDPYASLLVTTEDLIQQNPELVRNVVQASVEGWQSYLQNPTPVNEALHQLNRDMSLEALEFGVTAMKPLCETDGAPFGQMSTDRWQTLIDQIEQIGEIEPKTISAEDCFTNEFLPSNLE